MNIYQVVVDCWYRVGKDPQRVRRTIEVEADSIGAARQTAIDFCDTHADSSKELMGIEFRSAHKVARSSYPREVFNR